MARKPRIQYEGALYHVCSRGDRQEPIFEEDDDRYVFLELLGKAAAKYDLLFLAYCLMGNHYHLILQTRLANLSAAMQFINGVYTQRYNKRHSTCGHVFQGRFFASLVQVQPYMTEVCRYVELNPVRARLVQDPHEWKWSSYRAHIGLDERPSWLAFTLSDDGTPVEKLQADHTEIIDGAKP
ncbi:transposase [Pseudoduganella sp. GCM10020061]|uniref:transposase n=1 Tax=Pseudoduganella sp. GCM10020061 TaxID=3317345 RepID=UPI00363B2E63